MFTEKLTKCTHEPKEVGPDGCCILCNEENSRSESNGWTMDLHPLNGQDVERSENEKN